MQTMKPQWWLLEHAVVVAHQELMTLVTVVSSLSTYVVV